MADGPRAEGALAQGNRGATRTLTRTLTRTPAPALSPHPSTNPTPKPSPSPSRDPRPRPDQVLLKLLRNVLGSPAEPKYRTLRMGNAVVAAAVNVPGVLVLLAHCGFEQSDDAGEARLILPPSRPLPPLQA